MVDVSIRGSTAVFEVLGLHKLWTFRSRLEIPLAHIRDVRVDPSVSLGWWKGWRMPGTHVPGLIVAGTYYHKSQRLFWDVVRSERAIVVELVGESYDQLIVEVADPGGTAALLEEARRGAAA